MESAFLEVGVVAKAKSSKPTKSFSVLQHRLVPKHEVLSKEEAEQLLARLGVPPQQLPYILINDPVVKELGAKVGDIIKITRESETAGKAVYYRVVVKEA